jgi:hypothetical protein
MPAGSVRAIMALGLVGAIIAGLGGDNVATLGAAVVAFYFGQKAAK